MSYVTDYVVLDVLGELRAHPWGSPEDVTVLVKEQDHAGWRGGSSTGGS